MAQQFLTPLKAKLFQLQEFLDFEHAESPHFIDENGAGRHGIAGVGLGLMFGFSAATVLLGSAAGLPFPVIQWCIFTCLLAFFHIGEWYVAAAYRPKELGYRSWIINHSIAYTAAQLAAAVEFWLEWLLIPSIKGITWLVVLSTLLCIGAIGVRIVGMSQCGSNFDHIVMNHKKEGHQLVTEGLYQYLRHPSYFGWFYWSVCSQLVLGNPICFCGFFWAAHGFFRDRIPPEEETLVEIYKEQYIAFGERTPIGIPFMKSHVEYKGRASGNKSE